MKYKWFRKKYKESDPDFWKKYIDSFDDSTEKPIYETRFVAFDTETTGFHQKKDRVLSIGAVSIVNKSIEVKKNLEIYINQSIFNPETVKIHGLLREGPMIKIEELEAIEIFLDYINNDILVAHHVGFDYGMINQILLRNGLGKLQNQFIDTGYLFAKSKHIIYHENLKEHYTLDDLAKELDVPLVDRHTATGDALITAIVFLKIISRLDKRKNLKWDYLLNS